MGFFTTALPESAETLPRRSHLQYTEEQLAKVSVAYHDAEERFNEACAAIVAHNRTGHFDRRFAFVADGILAKTNAMGSDPERSRLERVRDRTRFERNRLLEERAALLKSLGQIR